MVHQILVSSYAGEITTLIFDPEASSLTVAGVTKTGPAVSWLALHPTDPSLLFAANETSDGKVQLFKLSNVTEEGANEKESVHLELLAEHSSGGADPASLVVTESAVILGNVRVLRLRRSVTTMLR